MATTIFGSAAAAADSVAPGPAEPAVAATAPAAARFALGISGLQRHSENTIWDSSDDSKALGAWVRASVAPGIALQLEGDKEEHRLTAGGRVVVDLFARGRLAAVALAGAGYARAEIWSGYWAGGYMLEAGGGLEYRVPSGLFLGVGIRGGRDRIEHKANPTADTIYPPVLEHNYVLGRLDVGAQF